jgi:DNA polymerase-1
MGYNYAVIDIEATGLDRFKNKITYVGIALAEDIGCPVGKTIIYNMFQKGSEERLKKTVKKLRERNVKLIFQGGKFDTLFLQEFYGFLLPIHHDVLLMGTAYDLVASHKLKDMAVNYLGSQNWDIPLKEKIKPNNPIVEKYLEKDLSEPWELFCFFHERLTEKQWLIYNELLKPAYLMYRRAERRGIYLDQKAYRKVRKDYREKQAEKLATLKKRYDINWNSPQQVSEALFGAKVTRGGGEGLPVMKLSKKTGKPSSDAKVLKRLAAKGFDLPTKLLDYKFYYGANTKFLNKWGIYAEHDGRIHPNFGLTNVVTGRTSCSNPNLQQVPRNKELRSLFTEPPGWTLMEADYSQIELRIAADYSNDPTMIKVYAVNGDIHTETGCSLAGCSPKDLTKKQRTDAKPVNFGFLFGMSANGFLEYAFDNYGIIFTKQQAGRYRELFFNKYNRLLPWHKEMEQTCELLGGVENRWGQFRALPDIYSHDRFLRSGAARRAINTPVQGTASGLLLLAAVEIDHVLRKEIDLHIVGTVHDSILMGMPDDVVKDATVEIKRIMAHPAAMDIFGVSFKVPILADVSTGAWGGK